MQLSVIFQYWLVSMVSVPSLRWRIITCDVMWMHPVDGIHVMQKFLLLAFLMAILKREFEQWLKLGYEHRDVGKRCKPNKLY